MKLDLIRHLSAERDIIECADYIARDSYEAAIRFMDCVESAFLLLLERPKIGALREGLVPGVEGIRMWPVGGFEKYLIFYQQIPNRIEILRVLHSARDIESIFEGEG